MHARRVVAVLVFAGLVTACGGSGTEAGGPADEPPAAAPEDTTLPGTAAEATGTTGVTGTSGTTGTAATSTVAPAVELVLPAPAADPGPDPDGAATALAAATVAGGDGGLPAVLRALDRSGIDVRDGGEVVQASAAPQGIRMDAEDVLAMATLFPGPDLIALDRLAGIVAAGLDPAVASTEQVADALVASVTDLANGTDPTLRFFARYLDGLRADGSTPVVGAASGREVVLTSPQAMLLLWRMAGDVGGAAYRLSGGVEPAPAATPGNARPVLREDDCEGYKRMADWSSTIGNAALNKWFDLMEDGAGMAWTQAADQMLNVAGLLTAIGKIVAMSAALEVTSGIMDGRPLKRSVIASSPGESRVLEATLKFSWGGEGWVKCLAPFMKFLGFDPTQPDGGVPKDAIVMWFGQSGFTTGSAAGIVEFDPDGMPRIANKGDWATRTDAKGYTVVGIRGRPPATDRPTVSPQVTRTATYRVALDLTEKDAEQVVMSAITYVAGGGFGIFQAMVDSMIQFLIAQGAVGRTFSFQVIDRAPDALVNTTNGPMTLSGTLCAGKGSLAVSGTTDDVGMTITFSGSIDVQTDTNGNGTYTSGIEVRGDLGGAPVNVGLSATGGGAAELRAGGEGQWLLTLKGGLSNIFAQGTDGNLTISTELSAQGDDVTLPATAGTFCEAAG